MVDRAQIERELTLFYRTFGKVLVDDQGLVTVKGDVVAREFFPGPSLPVRFDTVQGDYVDLAHQPNLLNLKGSPRIVSGSFKVRAPQLTSLEGAPTSVGDDFVVKSNSLRDLQHLPRQAHAFVFNITPHLGLLNLLNSNIPVTWAYPTSMGGVSNRQLRTATAIIKKYQGKGPSALMDCAVELATEGCKDNAR